MLALAWAVFPLCISQVSAFMPDEEYPCFSGKTCQAFNVTYDDSHVTPSLDTISGLKYSGFWQESDSHLPSRDGSSLGSHIRGLASGKNTISVPEPRCSSQDLRRFASRCPPAPMLTVQEFRWACAPPVMGLDDGRSATRKGSKPLPPCNLRITADPGIQSMRVKPDEILLNGTTGGVVTGMHRAKIGVDYSWNMAGYRALTFRATDMQGRPLDLLIDDLVYYTVRDT